MADYTKSATTTLLAHQELEHAAATANVVGGDVDCSEWMAAQVTAWLGKSETTANATGPAVIIQGSIETAGNDWVDIVRFTGSTTIAEAEPLTENEAIGVKEIAVAATANLVVGGLIYIVDDTGVAESEWHEIVAVTLNTSITLMDGLAVAKVAGDDLYTQAERFSVLVDCSGLKRVRACVVHQAATGSNMRVKVTAVALTDIE